MRAKLRVCHLQLRRSLGAEFISLDRQFCGCGQCVIQFAELGLQIEWELCVGRRLIAWRRRLFLHLRRAARATELADVRQFCAAPRAERHRSHGGTVLYPRILPITCGNASLGAEELVAEEL